MNKEKVWGWACFRNDETGQEYRKDLDGSETAHDLAAMTENGYRMTQLIDLTDVME